MQWADYGQSWWVYWRDVEIDPEDPDFLEAAGPPDGLEGMRQRQPVLASFLRAQGFASAEALALLDEGLMAAMGMSAEQRAEVQTTLVEAAARGMVEATALPPAQPRVYYLPGDRVELAGAAAGSGDGGVVHVVEAIPDGGMYRLKRAEGGASATSHWAQMRLVAPGELASTLADMGFLRRKVAELLPLPPSLPRPHPLPPSLGSTCV